MQVIDVEIRETCLGVIVDQIVVKKTHSNRSFVVCVGIFILLARKYP